MVGTSAQSRWNQLRSIMSIRHGPGAAILPPSITRLHMEFARTTGDGHMGPKKFWREILPRLKFHNPTIPMIVNRKPNNEGTAVMSIYYQTSNSASAGGEGSSRIQPPSSAIDTSKAVAPGADERVVKIDMKHKHSDDILAAFLAETKAEAVKPTPEEEEELRRTEEFRLQGEKDRAMVKAHLDKIKREADLLQQARDSSATS